MQEPETPDEWQAALDTVVALLAVDAAAKFRLAKVDVARCGEILSRAKALGYRPSKRTLEWVTAPTVSRAHAGVRQTRHSSGKKSCATDPSDPMKRE